MNLMAVDRVTASRVKRSNRIFALPMNSIVISSFLYIVLAFECNAQQQSQRESLKSGDILSRKARRIGYYPYQSGFAFEVAAAIPLDNGRADVFLSFCFAIAIGVPEYDAFPDGIDPTPFKTIYEDTLDAEKKRQIRNTNLTRRKFHRMFADNLKQYGFNANDCLLKAICETAQYQFGSRNGVLGDIIHVLLTPTTSKDEQLPMKFYEAEANGHLNLCDEKYGSKCPVSIFDLITVIK